MLKQYTGGSRYPINLDKFFNLVLMKKSCYTAGYADILRIFGSKVWTFSLKKRKSQVSHIKKSALAIKPRRPPAARGVKIQNKYLNFTPDAP